MTLNEFQEAALASAIYPEKGNNIIYPTLKLCGEAGEVAEKVGKCLRDNEGIFTHDITSPIALELGDVLWYCAAIAYEMGYTLEYIAYLNQDKLKSRIARGVIHGSGDNR